MLKKDLKNKNKTLFWLFCTVISVSLVPTPQHCFWLFKKLSLNSLWVQLTENSQKIKISFFTNFYTLTVLHSGRSSNGRIDRKNTPKKERIKVLLIVVDWYTVTMVCFSWHSPSFTKLSWFLVNSKEVLIALPLQSGARVQPWSWVEREYLPQPIRYLRGVPTPSLSGTWGEYLPQPIRYLRGVLIPAYQVPEGSTYPSLSGTWEEYLSQPIRYLTRALTPVRYLMRVLNFLTVLYTVYVYSSTGIYVSKRLQ